MLSKQKLHAFGKDIYLIGRDKQGIKYWLEAPSWDCNWYWGFGYIETYTNNRNPEQSRDISSHSHWEYAIVGSHDEYNFEKSCWQKSEYVYHPNENKMFEQTVLTDKESWELADLMKRFYVMQEMAGILHGGTSNLTSSGEHKTTNDEFRKWINEVELPELFKAVIKILAPEQE